MAISEEGRIILSNHSNSLTEIYEYDLRQNKIKHTFDKNSISGGLLPEADLNFVGGILKDGFFLIPTRITRESKLRSEEHTSELQSRGHLVCCLLLENK